MITTSKSDAGFFGGAVLGLFGGGSRVLRSDSNISAIKKMVPETIRRNQFIKRMRLRLTGGNRIISTETLKALRSRHLKDLASRINLTPCEVPTDGVVGWLSWNERRALYSLARWIDGPFLEVGSWAGLSTCHIATAIRDSGKPKRFITTCLNETIRNFRECGSSIGFFYPPESNKVRGLASRESFEADIKPVITSDRGVIGTLMRNLSRFDLEKYVEVREGSFDEVAPKLSYMFVFADALHDPDEIELNAPLLRDFLSRGTIVACHDVTMDSQNEARIRKHLPIGESFVIDSLLIGEIV
jgi:predicted O-methyltransferase YrrM